MPRIADMISRPITPTTGLWAELDEDMQQLLCEIAFNVKTLLGRGKSDDAHDEMESYHLEPEALAALWTRFESGERRILKAVAETRKDRM